MILKKRMRDLVEQEVRNRWGAAADLCMARKNGRYLGPVYSWGGFVLQYISPARVILHLACEIRLYEAEGRRRLVKGTKFAGQVLSIYYVGGESIAYCRTIGFPVQAECNKAQRVYSPFMGDREKYVSGAVITAAAVTAAALALAACASKSKLITPNGKDRVAINTPASLSKYQDIVARQDAITLERSELQRKVELLSAQVATLKAYVVDHERKEKTNDSAPQPAQRPPPKQGPVVGPSVAPIKNASQDSTEAIIVGEDHIVFRVSEDIGRTDFSPTVALEEGLLKAAYAAKSISIRGRTDAVVADQVESRIALERAVHARQFLLANGVDVGKIKTWYRAAGGFVVDNGSVEGRALNRRVEIETRGLDTSAYAPLGGEPRLGRNQ